MLDGVVVVVSRDIEVSVQSVVVSINIYGNTGNPSNDTISIIRHSCDGFAYRLIKGDNKS